MIPVIGLMIGMYIITRMIELLSSNDRMIIAKIFAGLTILSTAFFMIALERRAFNLNRGIP